jgi:hypothetical protein
LFKPLRFAALSGALFMASQLGYSLGIVDFNFDRS